ncbi:hypothetical protein ABZ023_23460 [Streptomyces sp. NPDC006367]|uniref:hypothetical protein n=1 Tax=unclassified Streptomyces TaxID=2593676 RepID=UPI0033B5EEC7
MADEHDGWLDPRTAEILLRGESLEAVDPAVRDRAERLGEALAALSAHPAPTSEDMPGEAAALAAFRAARADRAAEPSEARAAPGHGAPTRTDEAGAVRVGPRRDGARGSRRRRPLRLGLAAALAAGMVGGVAVAAGSGVLPTMFGGPHPAPSVTASVAASPDRTPAPSAPPGSATPGTFGGDTASGGTAGEHAPDAGDREADGADGADGRRREHAASCRDMRDGKALDDARRRTLGEAAGGASRVGTYCRGLLAAGPAGNGSDGSPGGHGARKDTDVPGLPDDAGGKGGRSDENGRSGRAEKEERAERAEKAEEEDKEGEKDGKGAEDSTGGGRKHAGKGGGEEKDDAGHRGAGRRPEARNHT